MSDSLPDEEFELARKAPTENRYDYAVRRIAHFGAVWSLTTDDGWVLYGDDAGREIIPIWPDARYAELCAIAEFSDAKPRRISVDDWVEQWTPALNKHERVVAVFPDPEGNAIVVTADDFEDDILFDYSTLEVTEGDEDDDEDEEWEIEME